MLSPNPMPPRWRVVEVSACVKALKACDWNRFGMPGPWSATETLSELFCRPTLTSMSSLGSVNLIAFERRLSRTC